MHSVRLASAAAAVREAGRIIRLFGQRKEKIEVRRKKNGGLVTNADVAADRSVLEMIGATHPQDGFFSEESGVSGQTDKRWILDPLDGTTNFVHGLPDYCVSLAFERHGVIEIGAVYDVCRDDLYLAERNRGAQCNERKIRVSGMRRICDALIAVSGSSKSAEHLMRGLDGTIPQGTSMRRTGSSALDMALCAAGAFDGALGLRLQHWDYAAGKLLITEAGGYFVDVNGNPYGESAPPDKLPDLAIYGSDRIVGWLRRAAAQAGAKFTGSADR